MQRLYCTQLRGLLGLAHQRFMGLSHLLNNPVVRLRLSYRERSVLQHLSNRMIRVGHVSRFRRYGEIRLRLSYRERPVLKDLSNRMIRLGHVSRIGRYGEIRLRLSYRELPVLKDLSNRMIRFGHVSRFRRYGQIDKPEAFTHKARRR